MNCADEIYLIFIHLLRLRSECHYWYALHRWVVAHDDDDDVDDDDDDVDDDAGDSIVLNRCA